MPRFILLMALPFSGATLLHSSLLRHRALVVLAWVLEAEQASAGHHRRRMCLAPLHPAESHPSKLLIASLVQMAYYPRQRYLASTLHLLCLPYLHG